MHPFIASSLLSLVLGLHEKVNNHSLLTACLPFMMLQTPASLIFNRPIHTMPWYQDRLSTRQVLTNLGCSSSRSLWFLGILLCNAAICTDSVQHPQHLSPVPLSPEGVNGDGPQHMDFSHYNSLVGWIPPLDSLYWSMFSYENVGQIPSSGSMRSQSFWLHSVRYSRDPASKKTLTMPFQLSEPQAIPHRIFCFENCVFCHHLDFSHA